MKLRTNSILLAGGLFAASLVHAESTPSVALLVLSKSDHTLAIVADPQSLKVIAQNATSGPDPHEVVASTDGKFRLHLQLRRRPGTTRSQLSTWWSKKLCQWFDLGALRGPHGLMFVGGKVWFTAEAAKVIGTYDPASKTIDWVLGTGFKTERT